MQKRTVLFVDDELIVLQSLKRGLREEPYDLLFADSGKEALKILAEKDVHVLITDVRMPEMSGLELINTVKSEYPHIIRIALSEYSEVEDVLKAINEGEVFRYVLKKWRLQKEIKMVIRQAIEFYDLHREREMLMRFFEQLVEGNEPDQVSYRLIREFISMRKEHLFDWDKKCKALS